VIARAQRLTVLMLLAVSALWFGTRAWDGQWVSAIVGVFLLMNLQALILTIEFFVLLPWINRGDASPRPRFGQVLRAWWRESVTGHAIFSWQQPFRAGLHADSLDDPQAKGKRAVVLVHGFFCNRGIWNAWCRRFKAEGVPYIALTLEPPLASIDDYAATIDDAVRRAADATGLPPLLVGHSMGGLAIRAWWRAQGDAADARVHSVITIGSPHQGTFTANMAKGLNARQMRLRSPWLAALAQTEPPERRARFTCFYSHCDNISMPSSTGALPGADNRHLDGQPHVALAFAPEVIDEVLRRVKATTPPA
jgi:triacylglycerol lipase